MKAIIVVCDDENAETISRLFASVLSMNGYSHNNPSVVDIDDSRLLVGEKS